MAEKFADLRQRSSLPEHLTGECVPELVSSFAGSTNLGPYQRMAHHGGDPGLTLETYGRRSRPEEKCPTEGANREEQRDKAENGDPTDGGRQAAEQDGQRTRGRPAGRRLARHFSRGAG